VAEVGAVQSQRTCLLLDKSPVSPQDAHVHALRGENTMIPRGRPGRSTTGSPTSVDARWAPCGSGGRDRAGDRAPNPAGSSGLRGLRQRQRPSCWTQLWRLSLLHAGPRHTRAAVMEGRRFRAYGYSVGPQPVGASPRPGRWTTLNCFGGPCFCGASTDDDAARTASRPAKSPS
jgi:hypothetical protein